MKRFARGLLAGIAAVFGSLALAYVALATWWPNSLPPPAITRLVHLDLKLRFLRDHPAFDPRILAVGSSITWRQLDGAAFAAHGREAGNFVNGATGALQIHQTRDLLNFYLKNYRNVRTVIVMVGPPDLADCTRQPSSMLDHRIAADYVFGHWPAPYFYLRNFSPQRYLRTAMTLAERETPFTGDLFLDPYGSGPLQIPMAQTRGLRYGPITADPACVESLVEMSADLAASGRRLLIVFPPMHPAYRRSFPEAVERFRRMADSVQRRTEQDGTRVLSLYDHPGFAEADFFDAFHLQWPGVERLTTIIVTAMDPAGCDNRRLPPVALPTHCRGARTAASDA